MASSGSSSKATPIVQKMIGEATMKFAYREFQQAIALLLEVVRLSPGLPHAYHTLGLIYEETGQVHKALKLFMMAAHLSKRDAHAWKQLAQLSKKHGELQQCIYCLQRVLAIEPEDRDAQWERALLLSEMGEHRRAAKALLPLVRQRPDDAHVVRHLVRSYHRLGYTSRAIHLLDTLVAVPDEGGGSGAPASGAADPSAPRPPVRVDMHSLNMLLELLIETGRYREALTKLQQLGRASRTGEPPFRPTAAASGAEGPPPPPPPAGAPVIIPGGGVSPPPASSEPLPAAAAAQEAGVRLRAPLEIAIKEGVCYAHLGDKQSAAALWAPLLARENRASDFVDLLYEVALTQCHLREWASAFVLLKEVQANELYKGSVHLPIGQCLLALGRAEEGVAELWLAFDGDPTCRTKALTIVDELSRHGEAARALKVIERHLAAIDASSDERGGRNDPEAANSLAAHGVQYDDDAHAIIGAAEDGGAAAGIPRAPPSAADVRVIVAYGFALSSVGQHKRAARLFLPVERACARPASTRRSQHDAMYDVTERDAADPADLRPHKRRRGLSAMHAPTAVAVAALDAQIAGENASNAGAEEHAAHGDSANNGGNDGGHDWATGGGGSTAPPPWATVALEDLLGAEQRVHIAIALGSNLIALGRFHLAFVVLSRLLDDVRLCASTRSEFYGLVDGETLAKLRIACVRAAHGCAQWDVAHQQMRALCLARPSESINWALYTAIAGRARARGYDERWLLRLLTREPTSAQIAMAVAHHCLLSRSFKIALTEYMRLYERLPSEPLLLLCLGVAQMQMVMSRANKDRGHSVLLAFGWFEAYAKQRGDAHAQESMYNTARAYHHLGLSHLAVDAYQKVLGLSAEGGDTSSSGGAGAGAGSVCDLSREAAHNLARLCCASGSKDLARHIIRSMPV